MTDLPLPDSPTRPSVSPADRWKLTSVTAGRNRSADWNPAVRCSTRRMGVTGEKDAVDGTAELLNRA